MGAICTFEQLKLGAGSNPPGRTAKTVRRVRRGRQYAPDLRDVDVTLVWSSGGKDSTAAVLATVREHIRQGVPLDRIIVAHNDMGDVEWNGTLDLARRQADMLGLSFMWVSRRDGRTLIQGILDKGMFPDGKRRWCTSDWKRGPGRTLLTEIVAMLGGPAAYGRPVRVLQVYGFRAQESPGRKKKVAQPLVYNKSACGEGTVRQVWDWYPIHDWTERQVWTDIWASGMPYHWAYLRGMKRLSCSLCVLAGVDDLVTAARLLPGKAGRYLSLETRIGHTIKDKVSMTDVVRQAGWTVDYVLAVAAGLLPPPTCPTCAADLHGQAPTIVHQVPDDVGEAMFGRGRLMCNGRIMYDPGMVPASRFEGEQ